MNEISIEALITAGAHFGHPTSRWHPKFRNYISMKKNGVHIIDMKQTSQCMIQASQAIGKIVQGDGNILFVGTKLAVKNEIKNAGLDCKMPYVSNRWLGGTLTNNETISKSIKKLEDLEESLKEKNTENLTKKETLTLRRAYEKLDRSLGGIRNMKKLPDAIFIIDVNYEKNAVQEAKALGITIISIVDSNSSPEDIDYVIPSNDDSRNTARLITETIVKSFLKGKKSVPILDDIEDDFVEVDAKGKISNKKIRRKRKITAVEKNEPDNQKPKDDNEPVIAKENIKTNHSDEPEESSEDTQKDTPQEESKPSLVESDVVEGVNDEEPKDVQELDLSEESGDESDVEKS